MNELKNDLTLLQKTYQSLNKEALRNGKQDKADFYHGKQAGLGEAIDAINKNIMKGEHNGIYKMNNF